MQQHCLTSQPHLVMIEPPETRIRFRYKSEGGSHGALLARQKEGSKKIYPTVKLVGYDGNKDVYIRASLYTEDNEPHVFEFVGVPEEESSNGIIAKLQEDDTAIFTNLKILSKKKDEIYQDLLDRKMKTLKGNMSKAVRDSFEKKYNKEFKEKAKNIMNSVRLCFEAFENDTERRLCEPLFSDLICNQKAASKGKLKIHRMSSISGSWNGGDEVILLCDKVQRDKIKILFYEPGPDDESIGDWVEEATFTPADVHYQVAITFKTPRYKMNADKTVSVCLARDDERSESLPFTYKADFEGNPSKKRKNCQEPFMLSPERIRSENSSSSYNGETSEMSSALQQLSQDEALLINLMDIDEHLPEEIFDDTMFDADELLQMLDDNIDDNIDGLQGMSNISSVSIDGPVELHANINTNTKIFEKFMDKCISNKHPETELLAFKKKIQQKIRSYLWKKDPFGNTYLHLAVNANKNIQFILKMSQFANVDILNMKNDHQKTALHIAVQQNNTEAVKILLKYGCDPNLKDAKGNNCFHIACQNNCFSVLRYLLAQVDASGLIIFNDDGLMPLHIAVMNNSLDCYRLLRSHIPDKNILDQKAKRSPLHYAVEYQPQFVTILLNEEGIDVNIQDREGNTPLHLACAAENIEVIKQLLKAGSDPSLKNYKVNCNTLDDEEDDISDVEGQTPADITANSEVQQILSQMSNICLKKDTLEELSNLLNMDMKWKEIAVYFMDEKYIGSLDCSPNPAKTLLLHIQKENQGEFLKNVLEMTGLSEALEIIKQTHF